MRLSEAMRLGATLKPQSFSGFRGKQVRIRFRPTFPFIYIETIETACALASAFDASGIGYREVVYPKGSRVVGVRGVIEELLADRTYQEWATAQWPVINIEAMCPQCKNIDEMFRTIAHLNDIHRWSRERIADFVESHETLPFPSITGAWKVEAGR